jgi:hypothetical protein
LSLHVVEDPALLGGELDRAVFAGCAKLVGMLLRGGPGMPPQFQVLRDLVAGEMDADRTDYLLRDSLHCGVEYGRFDHRRMIECLNLHEGPGGVLEVALQRDGIHTFEALILARYQMNTQVYYHRLRRIYDHYLCRYFEAKGPEAFNTPEKVLSSNDVTALADIFRDADTGEGPVRQWAQRIQDRRHHRLVHETGEDANAMDLRYSAQLLEDLRHRFPDRDFIHDLAAPTIHKLLLPDDQSEQGLILLPLVDAEGRREGYVGERSHILRRVPRKFQVARIFCDLKPGEASVPAEIPDFAAQGYRKLGGR